MGFFSNIFNKKKKRKQTKPKKKTKRTSKKESIKDYLIKEAFEKIKLEQENQDNKLNKHDLDIKEILNEMVEIKEALQNLSLRPVQAQSKTLRAESKTKTKESKLRPAVKIVQIAEKNILKNMKKIIKNEIYKIIEHEETIPISRLKEIICEKKGFCSRASFFNYMKELKQAGLIKNQTIDGERVTKIKLREIEQESKSKTHKHKS